MRIVIPSQALRRQLSQRESKNTEEFKIGSYQRENETLRQLGRLPRPVCELASQ